VTIATKRTDTTELPRTDADIASEEHDTAAIRELIALLDSWVAVDEEGIQEQKETWAFLKQALDEDRLSNRKLFP
jgi:hypothetical protein